MHLSWSEQIRVQLVGDSLMRFLPRLDFTEEIMLNPPVCGYHPVNYSKYRRYRIEYGFECSCPEGIIYLPNHVDPDKVEKYLQSLIDKTDNP